jgi:hypothetical protein
MKKFTAISLLVVMAILLSTFSVMADYDGFTAKKTPGAQATAKADDKATRQSEKGLPPGQQKTPKANSKPQNFRGEISAASTDSITLTLADGSFATFALTADTRIKVPTLGNSASSASLLVGQKAQVRAKQDDLGAWVALTVSVIPGKPAIVHHVGTVTEYVPGVSITILDNKGVTFTFAITEATRYLPAERMDQLAVGVRVTIIAPRDVTGGPLTAKGIVIHPALEGTDTPDETGTPEFTETPEPTETPEMTETPEPTDTPEVTTTPTL